jgi:hypothetical protein
MTRLKELKQQHKYYKKKVEEIERERDIDRSSDMWKILRDHKKLKLHYKTEIANAKQLD